MLRAEGDNLFALSFFHQSELFGQLNNGIFSNRIPPGVISEYLEFIDRTVMLIDVLTTAGSAN